jgi:Flp pilus assembly protein TadG
MIQRFRRDEEGVALVTTLLATFALLTLLAAMMAYAIGSQPLSRRDQDWNAALAAANAGVDDYIFRLNQNGNYWLYTKASPDPANQAFTQFVSVAGPANEGKYMYDPDASQIKVDGTIKLTVTGKVRKALRTVKVTLRRRSFIDYLYFTNYETMDPALYTGNPFTPPQAQVACAKHYYEGRDPQCTTIYFYSRDTINGPLHSNDAINVSGTPTFNGDTSTSWNDPAGKRYLPNPCPGCAPKFKNPGDPKFLPPLTMPPSNSAIKLETNAPPTGSGGCLYTGPTKIVLNSNGTMNVTSFFTKVSNCAKGNNVPLPNDGVVYVQNVPSTPGDPNYTAGCPVGSGNPLGYPIAGDITTYACRDGDAFISGTLKGQLTIASEHSIIVIANMQYANGVAGNDLLGLVANNYVEVYHPVNSSGQNLPAGNVFKNASIQAAILSVQHSFRVQNYSQPNDCSDPLGVLSITGAIAQQYRGIVGTFSGNSSCSGYDKNYVYDQRLKYLEPPHFIDPVASAWGVVTWAEQVPNPNP